MIWLLSFLKLLAADSIILNNDCSTASPSVNCRIELETLKGVPGGDCPLFSTIQRSCSVYGEVSTPNPAISTIAPQPGQETDHSITQNGDVTIVTFNAANANGSTNLHGETIWSRPPPGSVQISTVSKASLPDVGTLPRVICLCSPSGIDIRPMASQNLAAALVAQSRGDSSQRRAKRSADTADTAKKLIDGDDAEEIENALTELENKAQAHIDAHIDEIDEIRPRPRREPSEADLLNVNLPFSNDNLVYDDSPLIPIQEVHEFQQETTKTPVNSTKSEKFDQPTPTPSTSNMTVVTEMVNITTRTTTAATVSPNDDHRHEEKPLYHKDHEEHGENEKLQTHQTIGSESTTMTTRKSIEKREVKSQIREAPEPPEVPKTTTDTGFINWDRRGPRG